MRKPILICLALLFLVSANVTSSTAQQPKAPEPPKTTVDFTAPPAAADGISSQQRRHPWGRFSPGAWSLVRVVNETFDEKGTVVSTGMTETRTTLVKVEPDGVTLQFETSAWVSGKRLDANPQTIKQCFHGGLCGKNIKVSELAPIKIAVDGKEIECRVESAELVDGKIRTTVNTYYNDAISPFVFKRESEATNSEKKTSLNRMTIMVDALDMPCEILDNIRSAAHYRVVREHADGARTTTLTYMSPEVPGGTIRNNSKKVDINGRVVSRSILELTDFGTLPTKKKLGRFRNKHRVTPIKTRRITRRQVECLPE